MKEPVGELHRVPGHDKAKSVLHRKASVVGATYIDLLGVGRITITLHEQQSISFIRGNLMPHCVANFLIYFNYLAIENQVARLDFFHQSIKLSQTFFIKTC